MGYSARPTNVLSLLAALGEVFDFLDADVDVDDALAAARAAL